MKRNAQYYPGQLRRLKATSVYKRAATNKLRGFWRSPSKQHVFRPLVVKF